MVPKWREECFLLQSQRWRYYGWCMIGTSWVHWPESPRFTFSEASENLWLETSVGSYSWSHLWGQCLGPPKVGSCHQIQEKVGCDLSIACQEDDMPTNWFSLCNLYGNSHRRWSFQAMAPLSSRNHKARSPPRRFLLQKLRVSWDESWDNSRNSSYKEVYWNLNDLWFAGLEVPLEDSPETDHRFMRASGIMVEFRIPSRNYNTRSVPRNCRHLQFLFTTDIQILQSIGQPWLSLEELIRSLLSKPYITTSIRLYNGRFSSSSFSISGVIFLKNLSTFFITSSLSSNSCCSLCVWL